MPGPLLLSRRFAPLFWCQFFAAFNDNFLKTALVFVILFHSDARNAEALITFASAVFIAPYFFLSALGGEIADRYDKARVAQWLKFLEIFIAGLARGATRGPHSRYCLSRCSALASLRRYSGRSNMASCLTISNVKTCPPAMRWWKARPSSPSCSERSSVDWLRAARARPHVCRSCHGFRAGLLDRRTFDSGDRRGRAASQDRQQHCRFDRGDVALPARGCAAVVGRDGDELVLARRHRGVVLAAATHQDATWRQRRYVDRLSRGLLGRGRRRVGPGGGHCARAHRSQDDADGRDLARRFRARSRHCDVRGSPCRH